MVLGAWRVACADHRSNATGVSDSSLGVAAGDPRKTPKTDSENHLERLWRSNLVADQNLGSPDGDA